jgi:hypothetical protein
MTDPSAKRGSSEENSDNIQDAVVVDETVVAEAEPLTDATRAAEPEIVAEAEPAGRHTADEGGEPSEPKVAGNRGYGVFLGLASAGVFAIIFATAVTMINAVQTGRVGIAFVQQPTFYAPIVFFAAGAIIIALIVNRAGWAAHVIGSIVVGLVVYFGTVGVLLLANGVIQNTPEQAQVLYALALTDPRVIAGGLVAREVSLWTGALVARRGRKVTERNRAAHAQWEAELAEKSAPQH